MIVNACRFIKDGLKKIGGVPLVLFIRALRRFLYFIFDSLGYFIFFLFSPNSKERFFSKEKIKNILIVRTDRIGDLILSTPAIRAVRKSFPEAKIELLVTDYTKDLVVNNTNLDRILIYKKDKLRPVYDLAFALHPGIRQNYLLFTSGASIRVGYTGWGGGFFLTRRLKDDRTDRPRHEVEFALEVVGKLGCSIDDKRLEVSLTEEGEKFSANFLKAHGLSASASIVVIHPGARQEHIRWRKDGFAAVADRLVKETGVKVILIGTKAEKRLIENMVSLMSEKPISAIGLRLTELVSLIKSSRLFLGNSTGPMHVAAALKVPVVAVFGNIHPLDSYQEWGPWGDGHIIVSKDAGCLKCHPSLCRNYRCMGLISVDDIFSACLKQLRGKRAG